VTGERILVTGASGFLGSTVAAALSREGYQVRRMVRRSELPLSEEVALVVDLLDRKAVRDALNDTDGVVHLAAHVHEMAATRQSVTKFHRANVEGTRLLLEEARAAGTRKFLFFSSVKAVGEANNVAWTEETRPNPQDLYGLSKLVAEGLVLGAATDLGMRTTVLRLPLAYGPRMKGNMLRLFDVVNRGIPLPFQGVRNKRSMVFSENVAEAVRCCLRSPAAGYETFFVSDDCDLSTPELLTEIGTALGKTLRLYRVPHSLLTLGGRIGDALGRPGRPFPVNSEVLQRLVGSLTVDSSKLSRLTGYNPKFSPGEGIRQTASWYLDRGYMAPGEHKLS
jgi:UDP-glucose 4-epimerase